MKLSKAVNMYDAINRKDGLRFKSIWLSNIRKLCEVNDKLVPIVKDFLNYRSDLMKEIKDWKLSNEKIKELESKVDVEVEDVVIEFDESSELNLDLVRPFL